MKAVKVPKNPAIAASAAILLNLAQVARADIICQKKDSGERVFVAITLTPNDPQQPFENPVVAVLNTGTKKISLTGSMENLGHRLYPREQYSLKDSEGNDVNVVRVLRDGCEFSDPRCTKLFFSNSRLTYGESDFSMNCQDFGNWGH